MTEFLKFSFIWLVFSEWSYRVSLNSSRWRKLNNVPDVLLASDDLMM